MRDYLSKWTWPRLIQLAVGLFFFRDYAIDGGQMAMLFGGVMFAQAVFNVGCFSSRGCSTPVGKEDTNQELVSDDVEVEYEELQ